MKTFKTGQIRPQVLNILRAEDGDSQTSEHVEEDAQQPAATATTETNETSNNSAPSSTQQTKKSAPISKSSKSNSSSNNNNNSNKQQQQLSSTSKTSVSSQPPPQPQPPTNPAVLSFLDSIRCGDMSKVNSFLVKKPNIVKQTAPYGYTCLHFAAKYNQPHILQTLLLESNDAIDLINEAERQFKGTPLHKAAYSGAHDCIALLLQYGADASIRDKNNKTALELAIEKDKKECIALLNGSWQHHVLECNKKLENVIMPWYRKITRMHESKPLSFQSQQLEFDQEYNRKKGNSGNSNEEKETEQEEEEEDFGQKNEICWDNYSAFLSWCVANHLIQMYNRHFGIIPSMYHYGGGNGGRYYDVLGPDGMAISNIPCGVVRVEFQVDEEDADDGNYEPRQRPVYYVFDQLRAGRDPVTVVQEAVAFAVRTGSTCTFPCAMIKNDKHGIIVGKQDIYLLIHQMVAELLSKKIISYADCDIEVDVSEYGIIETPTHPLRKYGVVSTASNYPDWIELKGGAVYVNMHDGRLFILDCNDNKCLAFEEWSGIHSKKLLTETNYQKALKNLEDLIVKHTYQEEDQEEEMQKLHQTTLQSLVREFVAQKFEHFVGLDKMLASHLPLRQAVASDLVDKRYLNEKNYRNMLIDPIDLSSCGGWFGDAHFSTLLSDLQEKKQLDEIQELNISNCRLLTMKSFSKIAEQLKNVKTLKMSNVQIPIKLNTFGSIKKLECSACNLTNQQVLQISKIEGLEELDISNNKNIIDESVQLIVKKLKLKKLRLDNCQSLKNLALESESLMHLSVVFMETDDYQFGGYKLQFALNCTNLESLFIKGVIVTSFSGKLDKLKTCFISGTVNDDEEDNEEEERTANVLDFSGISKQAQFLLNGAVYGSANNL